MRNLPPGTVLDTPLIFWFVSLTKFALPLACGIPFSLSLSKTRVIWDWFLGEQLCPTLCEFSAG